MDVPSPSDKHCTKLLAIRMHSGGDKLGMKYRKAAALLGKCDAQLQFDFFQQEMLPRPEEAAKGVRKVFFADAADAAKADIELLFLHACSPNFNLLEAQSHGPTNMPLVPSVNSNQTATCPASFTARLIPPVPPVVVEWFPLTWPRNILRISRAVPPTL
jgi:hypothetical protein